MGSDDRVCCCWVDCGDDCGGIGESGALEDEGGKVDIGGMRVGGGNGELCMAGVTGIGSEMFCVLDRMAMSYSIWITHVHTDSRCC